jgi:hypothetical protein
MDVDIARARNGRIRQFLGQLGTITLGVLIALLFESGAEWGRDRALVREAMANLESEIRDNKKEVDRLIEQLPTTRTQIETTLRTIDSLLKDPGDRIDATFRLSFDAAGVSTTSRSSAEATGALGHMDYAVVKRYSRVYDLQADFSRVQQQTVDELITALAVAQAGALNAPPSTVRPELEAMKQSLLRTLARVIATGQLARQLVEVYREALSGLAGPPHVISKGAEARSGAKERPGSKESDDGR